MIPPRKASERTLYRHTAQQILIKAGATILPEDSNYGFKVRTKAGDLLVDIGDDFCLCTRFENVEAAKALELGDRLNPHSGKWNWMGGRDHAGDMLDLAHFQQALRRIT